MSVVYIRYPPPRQIHHRRHHLHLIMGIFDNKFYNFIMLIFVSGIIVQIMNFFDIEFVFYISYLLWFIAIGIFVIVLPRSHSSVI
jgi:hypothetical protein